MPEAADGAFRDPFPISDGLTKIYRAAQALGLETQDCTEAQVESLVGAGWYIYHRSGDLVVMAR